MKEADRIRNHNIFADRVAARMTYKVLGEKYNIRAERARQITLKLLNQILRKPK
jgi:DNA-directed RNA polymerase sigma subunit (sigma70/sigma32)